MENLTVAYTDIIKKVSNADYQDAIQAAMLEFLEKRNSFETVEAAKAAINTRAKSRLIDRYRKNDTISEKAGNLKSYIFDSSAGEIKFTANKKKYTACLSDKQCQVFELLINGNSRNDICKKLNMKKAALSRLISRVLEIIKAESLVDYFQYDSFPTGRIGYSENAIVHHLDNHAKYEESRLNFHIDNEVIADPDFRQVI
jgi:DNA-directed RNA polymerase specialized sigma24 family protein